MKKKLVKGSDVKTKKVNSKANDVEEESARALDDESDTETTTSDHVSTPTMIPTKATVINKPTRAVNQQFLDLFWKLTDTESDTRVCASLDIIKCVTSDNFTASQLAYTMGRLVQGLASTRECARHGYYTALVGILKSVSTTRLPNAQMFALIRERLEADGDNRECMPLHIGKAIAYGALLKSGRITDPQDILQVTNSLIGCSRVKFYMHTLAFKFLEELSLQVDKKDFKETVWPAMKSDLSRPWEHHSYDSLHLLLVLSEKYPKVITSQFWDETFGCSSLSDSKCFSDLTKFILTHSSETDHPLLGKLATILVKSGRVLEFWTGSLDPALAASTNQKGITTMKLLTNIMPLVEDEMVGQFLTTNVVSVFVSGLRKEESKIRTRALSFLEFLQTFIAKEGVSAKAQIKILKNLFQFPNYVAFDRTTSTQFVTSITPSLKKETIMKIAEMYHKFVGESPKRKTKIYLMMQLPMLINHPAVSGEVDWKVSQLVHLAKYGYFSKPDPKGFTAACQNVFHRARETPSRKLEDLAAVLSKTFDEINELVPDSDISDEVKASWNTVHKSVQKMTKKNRSKRKEDDWITQVFQVLYLQMGFEMLRNASTPTEIFSELDTCYSKAMEKRKSKKVDDEPNWLQVVVDILLSLLSQDHHFYRSLVVSVWSGLLQHITLDILQQVLDVIDPSKKVMPLVDAEGDSEEEEGEEEEGSDESDEENPAEAGDDQKGAEDEEDDEEGDDDDDMDDEEETVTDKLRMRIHEALGDGAALTDTESVDLDELSDSQMESLDRALSSAFREFRKARPVKKKTNKLAKDQTALMHFRIRCFDLIEVLADKEVGIRLTSACLLPILSLMETVVKEPLLKPLMDRAINVLAKLIRTRRFADKDDVQMEYLVKLMETLFAKAYAKKALMPYIAAYFLRCCSFLLRCTVHVSRTRSASSGKNVNANSRGDPHVQVEGVYQLYRTHLAKFMAKRDSPLPLGVFAKALDYPWPDAGFLMEPLIEYAFGPAILNNRKMQAVNLLTALFRNSTALSAVGQSFLAKQLHSLLDGSRRALEEAGADCKPKYLKDLFLLLRLVRYRPELVELNEAAPGAVGNRTVSQLWEPFKAAFTSFTAKGLAGHKELKSSHSLLAQAIGVALDQIPTVTTALNKKNKPAHPSNGQVVVNGDGTENTATAKNKKNKKAKRPANKEKMEKKEAAKKRRMELTAKGFTDMSFTQLADDEDVENAAVDVDKASPDVGQANDNDGATSGNNKMKRANKATDTNGNQVDTPTPNKKSKKNAAQQGKKSADESTTETNTSMTDTPNKTTSKKANDIKRRNTEPDNDVNGSEQPSPVKKIKKKRKSTMVTPVE